MAAAKTRGKIEGWELDVSETDADVGRSTLRQRLSASNKVYALCLLGLVVAVIYFGVTANKEESVGGRFGSSLTSVDRGSVDEAKRVELARNFATNYSKRFGLLEARFVGQDRFRIVVPATLNRDDIEFIAKVAGTQILAKLKIRPVVQVYTWSARQRLALVATAQWQPEKYGFVVRMAPLTE